MLKEKARVFAEKAHKGQFRKIGNQEMIAHPIAVAKILEAAGLPEEVVVAGYLHDTVEDTNVSINDIKNEFGVEVARLVEGNTENKELTWEERKQHTIDWVAKAPFEVRALIIADKLDNLQSMIKGYEELGEELWSYFKRGYEQQKWYFSSVCHNVFKDLENDKIPAYFFEYKRLVDSFFQK
ncbi:bifunctional (p)ppGpp synthetase/guanosine-3',5'-bis(diphosphate) 3'-pyrophosphohydrolase [Bacillus sp. RG28]|uniref:Bifunctional (P)ppGpp synthetase/guanosine-3',5'-bis(Diphosphate) 3'-pyrophosphohydrolase n=1 Tax=Gottfriedia endophytica TaxID=2820819 RepID=A0A940SKR7_9BACI|nr:HD domain-containing protein [Gottfriedia endophytica]MBP0726304.1 bifunctional (p)ppGpp synthetase/guanosine-3',5'-bis(diphosphate) 3'-pyrophosphohydrolase [Gottfriedia endophytica]